MMSKQEEQDQLLIHRFHLPPQPSEIPLDQNIYRCHVSASLPALTIPLESALQEQLTELEIVPGGVRLDCVSFSAIFREV